VIRMRRTYQETLRISESRLEIAFPSPSVVSSAIGVYCPSGYQGT
jgi:hypothetical protein